MHEKVRAMHILQTELWLWATPGALYPHLKALSGFKSAILAPNCIFEQLIVAGALGQMWTETTSDTSVAGIS